MQPAQVQAGEGIAAAKHAWSSSCTRVCAQPVCRCAQSLPFAATICEQLLLRMQTMLHTVVWLCLCTHSYCNTYLPSLHLVEEPIIPLGVATVSVLLGQH